MRGCFKAALAFGMVAVLAGPAMAQGGRGMGGGMGGGPVALLTNPGVQKELKLTPEQIEKLTAVGAEIREKMSDVQSQLEGLDRQEQMAKRQELMKPINEEAMKSAKKILKDEQYTRLTQIEIQQRGAMAFTDKEIAKKLSVTEEQTTKIKTLMADMQAEQREIMQSAGDDRQGAMRKSQELRAETSKKVMALMSDDQKKTWKELTGEPYTVVMPQRGAR
jgi:Spy/CpxP family protein refolding chaperone